MGVFQLWEVQPHIIVLKVVINNNLDVARNPYISGDYDYITVTRGGNHILTIVKKDGKTFSFHWGTNGNTLVSDELIWLRKEVVKFIEDENHILLGWDSGLSPTRATICYNNYYKKWQLTLECKNAKAHWFSPTAETVEAMMKEADGFVDCTKWEHSIAVTGIDVWRGVFKNEI